MQINMQYLQVKNSVVHVQFDSTNFLLAAKEHNVHVTKICISPTPEMAVIKPTVLAWFWITRRFMSVHSAEDLLS